MTRHACAHGLCDCARRSHGNRPAGPPLWIVLPLLVAPGVAFLVYGIVLMLRGAR